MTSYQRVHLFEPDTGDFSSQDSELDTKLQKGSEDGPVSGSPSPQVKRRWCFSSCCPSSQEYPFLLQPDFQGLAVSFLLLASGCSLPFVYLVPYALSVGICHQHAAFLMSILGVIDIVGNITFGWLTDRRYDGVAGSDRTHRQEGRGGL